MSFDAKLVGAAIKHARERMGLSQSALGELMGVSRASVSYWELGTHSPHGHHMAALKEVLGLAWEEPSPPLAADQLAYWRGRVEQIAQHMAIVLQEQQRLAQDMGAQGSADTSDDAALAAKAIATTRAHAAQAAPAIDTLAPRRRSSTR